jgi:hypothetical protein
MHIAYLSADVIVRMLAWPESQPLNCDGIHRIAKVSLTSTNKLFLGILLQYHLDDVNYYNLHYKLRQRLGQFHSETFYPVHSLAH